jgi:hypothetical protein
MEQRGGGAYQAVRDILAKRGGQFKNFFNI